MHIGPFLFGTVCVVFFFLLQFLFKAGSQIFGKGLDPWVITKLIAYNLAWMLVLAVPLGVLVASLMAYGKLSGSNELTIIKSAGGSALGAMMPGMVGGLLLFFGLFLFNDRILPETNHTAMVMLLDIRQVQPTLAIEPGQLITLEGYSILARKVDRARNALYDVTIYTQDAERMNTITARTAELAFNQDYSRLLMTLRDGEIHQLDRRNTARFTRLSFAEHQVVVAATGFNLTSTDPNSIGRTDRTMNIEQMRARADSAESRANRVAMRRDSLLMEFSMRVMRFGAGALNPLNSDPEASQRMLETATLKGQAESEQSVVTQHLKESDQYWVEIHKKYSIPAACLVFMLVGAPLGIVVRRGNFGVSAAITLGFFVIYWACLVTGEKLADRGALPPAVAMWMADAIIGAIGLYLTILVSRETVTLTFEFNRLRRLFRRKSGQMELARPSASP